MLAHLCVTRMSLLLCLGLTFCLLFESEGHTGELYKVPRGERVMVNGITYQAFKLEDYKMLLKLDADLEYYEQKVKAQQEIISKYELMKPNLMSIVASKDSELDLLKKENQDLYNKWSTENKLRYEAERPKLSTWILWSIAGVTTAAAASLSIYIAAK
jgi:hypothetical protein